MIIARVIKYLEQPQYLLLGFHLYLRREYFDPKLIAVVYQSLEQQRQQHQQVSLAAC